MSFLFKSNLLFTQAKLTKKKSECRGSASPCSGSAPLVQSHFRDAGIYNCFSDCHQVTLMASYKLFVVRTTLLETKLKRKKRLTHALTTTTNQAIYIYSCSVQAFAHGHTKFHHRAVIFILVYCEHILCLLYNCHNYAFCSIMDFWK